MVEVRENYGKRIRKEAAIKLSRRQAIIIPMILRHELTTFVKSAQSFFRIHTVGTRITKEEAERHVWRERSCTTNKTYSAV
jgi:hypothetical protein